jgi:hypothetical protein
MRKSSPLQYRAASIGDHEPDHVNRPAAAMRRNYESARERVIERLERHRKRMAESDYLMKNGS